MSTYSYICEGLGNEDSFKSCSHGAGRTHTRTAAREEFTVQEVIEDLKANNIVLGKENKQDITEEYKGAYKDIHNVIDQQSDLIKPIDKMKTRAVIKG
jgi:tRNA-splicing ligase RtcB